MWHCRLYLLTISAVLLLPRLTGLLEASPPTEWLRGSGKDLQIRLSGEVVEADGRPAGEIRITGRLNAAPSNRPLDLQIDGHRFQAWIPVNKFPLHNISLEATSSDGQRSVYRALPAFELRQAAIDGIRLTLQAATRQVEIKVLDEGKPVPGATVLARMSSGAEQRSRADEEGIARLSLLPAQTLFQLTAWADAFRVGGYVFSRRPVRDPDANEHVIELDACRNQKIRLVDENNSPVPDVDFILEIGTGEPNFNFVGTNEHSHLRTNAVGEVDYHWFPDWKKHYLSAHLETDHWLVEDGHTIVDDAVVFKLKKSKSSNRKRVTGRVVSESIPVGGFYVSLYSFQGEQESRSDILTAFTDSDGAFSVDVLPDATYCAYAVDARFVSEIIDLIPYQSTTERITEPRLTVSEGKKVEVVATSGPTKRPFPNLTINFSKNHQYSWQQDGQIRRGLTGARWSVTTDEAGRAITYAPLGELKAAVYTPLWRTEEAVDVSSGAETKITLHREIDEKRKVTGRLYLPGAAASELEGIEVLVQAIDGNYGDEFALQSGRNGEFSFETMASTLGIFASTSDGRAAGFAVVRDFGSSIALHLQPTMAYRGRLLGEADRPIRGHGVRARVRIQGDEARKGTYRTTFEVKTIAAQTDEQGNFELLGVPTGIPVSIDADPVGQSEFRSYLGEVLLEPNESRPLTISRLGKRSGDAKKVPLAERYKSVLRDCALSGFHLMMVIHGDGKEETEFVTQNFVDYARNPEVAGFMQIIVSSNQEDRKADDFAFIEKHGWPIPDKGQVFVCALNGSGKDLGRLSLDISDGGSAAQAAEFVHKHAPPQVDAEQKWQEAFAEAKRSNRRVWARISGRYCGPCILMTRWLDEYRELLDKDYVMLKIDEERDAGGSSIAEQLTGGKRFGIPFHAIYDKDASMLINSAGPAGVRSWLGC